MDINVLRSLASPEDFQELLGFMNSMGGGFNTFLYADPDDNAVTGQTIATGNGTQTNFQLVRTLGGFVEPVLAPNAIQNVYLNGTPYNTATLSAPAACTLSSQAGGSLGATTYYVRATWNTATGQTLAGTESSLAVGANHQLIVTPPTAPAGATGWVPFVSNTAGGGSGTETAQSVSALSTSSSWTEPTSGLVTGAPMPSSNSTGAEVTLWGGGNSQGPGVLIFNGAPANGVVISADFTYYWPCRFLSDKTEFSLDFQGLYSVKSLTWQTVRN